MIATIWYISAVHQRDQHLTIKAIEDEVEEEHFLIVIDVINISFLISNNNNIVRL